MLILGTTVASESIYDVIDVAQERNKLAHLIGRMLIICLLFTDD
jgi:Kef-type K+ transport system membrane component KefB